MEEVFVCFIVSFEKISEKEENTLYESEQFLAYLLCKVREKINMTVILFLFTSRTLCLAYKGSLILLSSKGESFLGISFRILRKCKEIYRQKNVMPIQLPLVFNV